MTHRQLFFFLFFFLTHTHKIKGWLINMRPNRCAIYHFVRKRKSKGAVLQLTKTYLRYSFFSGGRPFLTTVCQLDPLRRNLLSLCLIRVHFCTACHHVLLRKVELSTIGNACHQSPYVPFRAGALEKIHTVFLLTRMTASQPQQLGSDYDKCARRCRGGWRGRKRKRRRKKSSETQKETAKESRRVEAGIWGSYF